MEKVFYIILILLLQSVGVVYAQSESILKYLTNPTKQEQDMLAGMSLNQIDKALKLYDGKAMVKQYQELTSESRGLRQRLREIQKGKKAVSEELASLRVMLINQITLLRMTGVQDNIDHALTMMRTLIDQDPSDISFMKPYLDVMLSSNEWDECDRVLRLFEANCKDDFDRIRIIQNQGMVAHYRNDTQKSIALLTQAFQGYSRYIAREGLGYRGVGAKVMMTCNVLSQQYYKIEERDSCIYYMDYILDTGDKVRSITRDDDTEAAYIISLISMSTKYKSYGLDQRADSVYQMSYNFLQKAYEEAPFRYGSSYVFYYMNQARDLMAKKQYDEAVKNSDKALEAMERLYKILPKWSAINYFEALRLRAELYEAQEQNKQADELLARAQKELDTVEHDNPGGNEMRYFSLYYDLAFNRANRNQFVESIEYFQKARAVVENLDPRLRDQRQKVCDRYIELIKKEIDK